MADAGDTQPTTDPKNDDDDLVKALNAAWDQSADSEPEGEPAPGTEPSVREADADDGEDRDAVPEGGEDEDVEAAGEDGDSDEEESETIEPPEDWSKEQVERFNKLDAEGQALVLQQHKEFKQAFTRKSEELSDSARFAETIRKEFEPYRRDLNMMGLNEDQAVRQLLTLNDYARKDPAGYIKWVAEQANVDLAGLAGNGQNQDDELTDPETRALKKEIATLRDQVQQLGGTVKEQQTSQQQQSAQAVQNTIQEFRQAQDESGNPKHPHFDKVEAHMAALLSQGAASNLQDAYDQAVWANPETRKQVMKDQDRRKEQSRKKEVEKARKASARNVRGTAATTGAGDKQPDFENWHKELERTFEQLEGQ